MTDPLTPRERRVLLAYAEYESVASVAHQLGLATSTVKGYMSTAYSALDVTNVVGAMKALGWLKVPAMAAPSGVGGSDD